MPKKSVRKKKVVKPASPFSSWHVGVAAEAIAAAQFARCGIDVSVQYGADQPEYDLTVEHDDLMMKVSVKGSKDGGWGLTQSHLTRGKTDYHAAIDKWVQRHGKKTVMCFVQFKGREDLDQMPKCYLATPAEVAQVMKAVAKGKGGTILYEHHVWTSRALGAGTVERIPDAWKFSRERALQLLGLVNGPRQVPGPQG
ncbi:MAG: hypothetical protein AB7N73_10005 [Gemmatimonadales bacterium]